MEENLISKKELLDLTGISYGQLYRWKRKQLIPEEWFIKKSSFTGQETFFPKEKILERIDKIVNMKEDLSLDDIADKVSAAPLDISLNKSQIIERNIISSSTLNYFIVRKGNMELFPFETILFLYIIDKKFISGELNLDEGMIIFDTLVDNFHKFEGKNFELVFIRKRGISSCLLALLPGLIFLDKESKILFRVNISNIIEELKLK